jgi:uncharacterized membrane protein
MSDRPKLKIELTTFDKIMEILGWIFIIAIWSMTIISYNKLPDVIPTHFNLKGEVDGYGEKWMILLLASITTILFLVMSYLNKFPHRFNYLTVITKDNALRQYTIATRVIRFLKLLMVAIFLLTTYQTIKQSNKNTDDLGLENKSYDNSETSINS